MKKRILASLMAMFAAAAVTPSANATTLLYSNPMNDGSDWSISIVRMNHSFGSGILNVSGSSTNAGNIVFVHRLDTRGFSNIVAEFDYRRGGSIVQWESSDWIRFLAYNQADPPTQASPLAGNSGRWTGRPPDSWTTRAWALSDTFAANNPNLWVGFKARTTQSGEIIQINNFRVFGTIIDCNNNGIGDNVDVANGTSIDCNSNAVPDECDIASGLSADTNGNGIPDECDIIIVNSLADPGISDDGLTTLREAMTAANASGGIVITFDPELARGTIQPQSPFPDIVGGNITINGDVNGNGVPDIEIDGSLAGVADGLRIHSGGNAMIGLVINRFERVGIVLFGVEASGNTVAHCYVGTNLDGTEARANGSVAIWMQANTSENRIGPGNVVSGNAIDGIVIDGGAGHAVFENIIGLDVSGTVALPNTVGVWIRSAVTDTFIGPGNIISGNLNEAVVISDGAHDNQITNNLIGTDRSGLLSVPNGAGVNIKQGASGNTIGPGNVISGNWVNGITIQNEGSDFNRVLGNFIGTDADGSSALPNASMGVIILGGASDNTVGPQNVISANTFDGVHIRDIGSDRNVVAGNFIGLDATGLNPLGNLRNGVAIFLGASTNIVGGSAVEDRNVISGNDRGVILAEGVGATPTSGNIILGNFIGLDLTGVRAVGNRSNGVLLVGPPPGVVANQIGPSNVISGNDGVGVVVSDPDTRSNTILGNLIGTDFSGNVPLGNGGDGVRLQNGVSGNTIGPDNVISGNSGNGIFIGRSGEPCNDNVVENNLIGIVADQSSAIGNDVDGIIINNGSSGNQIGPGNVIGGSRSNEIVLADVGTSGNSVFENTIGTELPSTYAGDNGVDIRSGASGNQIGPNNVISHNARNGILLRAGASNNTIGPGNVISANGTAGITIQDEGSDFNRASGNEVTWNGRDGVYLRGGSGTTISDNSITSNDGHGIAVAIGANGDIEPPVLTTVTATEVVGTASVPNGSLVEIFSDPDDEAETFLGSSIVSDGEFLFNGLIPSAGQITATVTDTGGNTSRLSVVEGVTGRSLFAVDCNLDALVIVDTLGAAEQVGSLGIDYVRGGLAHRPGGELYLLNEGGNLYQLSKRNGAAAFVGNIGYLEVEAACFRADGLMYVSVAAEIDSQGGDDFISLDSLVRVHPTSLQTTMLGEIGSDIDALVCLPDGRLLGVDTAPGENGGITNDFYDINPATGQGAFAGSIGTFNIVGLASQDDDVIALSFPSFLLSVDLDTLETTPAGSAGGPSMLSLAPTVPLPLAFGDFNDDGWTNLTDYSVFETCFSFSGPGAGPPFQECLDSFDWNDDGNVDLKDVCIFQQAFTGRP